MPEIKETTVQKTVTEVEATFTYTAEEIKELIKEDIKKKGYTPNLFVTFNIGSSTPYINYNSLNSLTSFPDYNYLESATIKATKKFEEPIYTVSDERIAVKKGSFAPYDLINDINRLDGK